MKTTKLDMYNYSIRNVDVDKSCITIKLAKTETYKIADISSSLTATNHQAYLDGRYYLVVDMNVVQDRLLSVDDIVELELYCEVLKRDDVI